MELQVCQFQIVSTEGFTPADCAQFCAHHQTLLSATEYRSHRTKCS
jgi:hypothetical protein